MNYKGLVHIQTIRDSKKVRARKHRKNDGNKKKWKRGIHYRYSLISNQWVERQKEQKRIGYR